MRRFHELMLSGSRFGSVPVAMRATWAAFVVTISVGVLIPHVAADPLPIGALALPGGAHVPSALPSPVLSVSASAAYGHTERLSGSDAVHERAFGDLSVALSPWPDIMLAVSGFAHFDAHSANGTRQDTSAALGSVYALRVRRPLSESLSLAGQFEVLFPPAEGVGRGLAAMTPGLRAVASYARPDGLTLSANAGFRLDRSRLAVANADGLSTNERVGADVSASQAMLLGVLGSRPVGGFTAVGEWSWDVGVGSRATRALTSPMRIELGLQRLLSGRLFAAGRVGVSPSRRPKADELVRIEPRVWCAVTLGMAWDEPRTSKATAPATAPSVEVEAAPTHPAPEAPAPELPAGQIRGRVRSLRGAPIKAQIEVMPLRQSAETDARGAFAIDVPPGHYTVVVRAERFETQERPADVEQNGVTILVLDLRKQRR